MSHLTALAARLRDALDTDRSLDEQLLQMAAVCWKTITSRLEEVRAAIHDDRTETLCDALVDACLEEDSLRAQLIRSVMDIRQLDPTPLLTCGTDLAAEIVREMGGHQLSAACVGLAAEGDLNTLQKVWRQHGSRVDLAPAAVEACRSGEQEVVEWMSASGAVDLHGPLVAEMMFAAACGASLETAQWVWSRCPTLDHHWEDESAFRGACGLSLECARWVYSLGGVDHRASGDAPFQRACGEMLLETAQWLHSLGVDHQQHGYELWCNALRVEAWEMATWLYSLGLGRGPEEFFLQTAADSLRPRIMRHLCCHGPGTDPELCDRALILLGQSQSGLLVAVHKRMAEMAAILIRAGGNPLLCDDWPDTHQEVRTRLRALLVDRRQKSARSGGADE